MSKSLPLSETHPELASQAFGWDPSVVRDGSTARKTWKCPEGHAFVAEIWKRKREYNSVWQVIDLRKSVKKSFNHLFEAIQIKEKASWNS